MFTLFALHIALSLIIGYFCRRRKMGEVMGCALGISS